LRCVLDREDVNLVHAHEPIDEPVRTMNDLANDWTVEFRHRPTGLGQGDRRDARRKIVIGGTVLAAVEHEGVPALQTHTDLVRWLDAHLERPHDRSVFDLTPRQRRPPLRRSFRNAVRFACWLSLRPERTCVARHPASLTDDSFLWYAFFLVECLEDLSGGTLAAVHNRIQQFEGGCSDEANWLYLHDIYEWTGNYNDGYEWEAFSTWWGSSNGYVAIHWPYLEDWYILAHEGAHGYNQNSSESFAIGRGNDCTYMLY